MILARVICLVAGYAFGLLQTSYIYGRMKGIDIREHGSGNAGTTNALRVLGKKAGLIVFIGDLFKAIIISAIVHVVIGHLYPNEVYLYLAYAGLGTGNCDNRWDYRWFLRSCDYRQLFDCVYCDRSDYQICLPWFHHHRDDVLYRVCDLRIPWEIRL